MREEKIITSCDSSAASDKIERTASQEEEGKER